MANEKEVLQGIYENLLSSMRPAARRFAFMWLRSTAEWAGEKKMVNTQPSRTFRPSVFFMVITIIIFGGANFLLIKEMIVNPGDKMGLMIFLLFLFGSFFLFALYQFFFNKKLNYNITVNASGITIAGDSYTWKNIAATGILTKGINRNKSHYLVIAARDGTGYKIYSLRLFVTASIGGIAQRLSRIIEQFKANGNQVV